MDSRGVNLSGHTKVRKFLLRIKSYARTVPSLDEANKALSRLPMTIVREFHNKDRMFTWRSGENDPCDRTCMMHSRYSVA